MTVLVTGGAGFIGCHLCEVLVARGERVVALDNLLLGRRTHLSALEGNAAFAFVEGDATDPATLDALFAEHRFDAVFHLAANSDIAVSHADPGVDFAATFRTSWAVLDAMRRHGTPRILFASTSAVYGEATGAIREDHGHAPGLGGGDGVEDVRAVARGGDRDQHVAFAPDHLHLPGEHRLEPEIVGDRGIERGVGAERGGVDRGVVVGMRALGQVAAQMSAIALDPPLPIAKTRRPASAAPAISARARSSAAPSTPCSASRRPSA